MTTPVLVSGSGSNATMAFVLPAKLPAGDLPKPTDGAVTVREWPAGCFAVLRFWGGRNPKNEPAALRQLKDWMTAAGLHELTPPVFAYFDPPWIPSFLRRNDVMLQTEPGKR